MINVVRICKLSSIIYKYAYLQHTQNGLEMPWIKAVKNILDNCPCSNFPRNLASSLQNLRWTRSIVSKFEKPQISQPYNRIGLTIL
jgi:hypothetical protein